MADIIRFECFKWQLVKGKAASDSQREEIMEMSLPACQTSNKILNSITNINFRYMDSLALTGAPVAIIIIMFIEQHEILG